MADLGLLNDDMIAISNVFRNNPAITRAVVFGSRAKGGGSLYADVDIALYGDIELLEMEDIICDLDELPLVYKFDVITYDRIRNYRLKQHIDKVGTIIYDKDANM